MHRLVSGVMGLVAGYALGALAGAALVAVFSTNTHDRSVELAMTSLVVAGPIGALLGLAAGLLRGGGRR